jgi:Domain of unknown function (DUF4203)
MHPVADLIVGGALLFLGRKLFWLFVAIAGFYLGFVVARAYFANQPEYLFWLIAIGAGVIGAVLAMLFQRVGFALAGFYAGGYLALVFAERFALTAMGSHVFIVGGVVGIILALLVMQWAIIVLSSLMGAMLIVASLALEGAIGAIAYVVLLALGIAVQTRLFRGTSRGFRAGHS